MARWLHTVVETPAFIRTCNAAGVSDEARIRIVDAIAADPAQGDEVQGSGGVRKLRIAGRGKGKSGGYRVMVAYVGEDVPAYLLGVLSKSDRADFSRGEVAAMKEFTVALKRVRRSQRRT